MNGFIKDLMVETEAKKATALLSRIKKYEDITDRLEVEISDYLRSVSQGELSQEASTSIRGMLSTISDLERIGDIYYQMSKPLANF